MRLQQLLFSALVIFISVLTNAGESARNFTLPTVNGENLSLDDFNGNVILLAFWETDCGACKKQLFELSRMQEKYRRLGFIVYAISVDEDLHEVRQFLGKNGIRLVTLMDSEQKVANLYNVDKLPVIFLIGKNGLVRYVHKGFNFPAIQKIEAELTMLLRESKSSRSRVVQTAKIE